MKTAFSMVALVLLTAGGCTSSSAAQEGQVTTSAKPTTRLYVRTIPEGADVSVDGKQRGKAPQLFEVLPGARTMTVEVELGGQGKQRKVVAIEGGRIIRVEFKFTEGPQPPVRHFVTLVVSKDRMTFEGKATTWEELPGLLEKVADRRQTVLNIARAPGEMTASQWDEARGRALKLVERLGFHHLSDIGVHPLGSEAEGTQAAPGAKPKIVSFGPVVELVLKSPEKGAAELLDLDTGRRATMTDFGADDRRTHAWVRRQKMDVMGFVEHGLPGVLLFDCAVYENPGISWDKVAPQEVVNNRGLGQTEPKPITPLATQDPSKLPLTCLFQTREGTRGVLQLLGLSDDKQGVKIRYKLVRQPAAGMAAHLLEVAHSRAQVETLRSALELYRLDVGRYPTSTQGLKALLEKPADLSDSAKWQGPYLKGPAPVDPWGNPYQYRYPARLNPNSFDVYSRGPDGVDATGDDIGGSEPRPRIAAPRKLMSASLGEDVGVLAVAFSPSGKTLATVDETGQVRLRNARAGTETLSFNLLTPRERMAIFRSAKRQKILTGGIAFSPDGATLAVGGGPVVKLYDVADGRLDLRFVDKWLIGTPAGIEGSSPPRPESGKRGGSVRGLPIPYALGQVFCVAFSPDGTLLATSGDVIREVGEDTGATGGKVKLWDAKTGELKRDLGEWYGAVRSVAFSPDGKTLASIGTRAPAGHSSVRLWDPQTGVLKRDLLIGRGGLPWSLAFSPDGNLLANSALVIGGDLTGRQGERNCRLLVWNARHKALLVHRLLPGLASLSFSADSKTLAAGVDGQGVILWDPETLQLKGQIAPSTDLPREIKGPVQVAFSPIGNLLAIGAENERHGFITVWEIGQADAGAAK
jgi:type II secretion system protein G